MIYKSDTVAYITKLPFIPPQKKGVRSDKQIKVPYINKLCLIKTKYGE